MKPEVSQSERPVLLTEGIAGEEVGEWEGQ
jgi:hypothetical protein